MARKGQIFNKYSKELKEEILNEYFKGNGGSIYLGKKYNISSNTIDTWIKIKKKPEKYLKLGKQGRTKEEDIDYKERYEILKNYRTFLKAQRERK